MTKLFIGAFLVLVFISASKDSSFNMESITGFLTSFTKDK